MDRPEDAHTGVTGQTEYESFFSVSPVGSVLMLFSVPPQSPFLASTRMQIFLSGEPANSGHEDHGEHEGEERRTAFVIFGTQGATEETGETGHDFVVINIENSRCPVSTVIPV